ncbi:transcriptional regulator [Streptomyces bobili]|uniref:transcriptional regulator n=1 Tax=Streptomyces bobili TaxID=67280 RepID=UPI0036FA9BEE
MPPILVNRPDLRVIDGMHRLLAAFIRGQEHIDVEFFEGSPEDAYLRAVEANVTHGLPLSLADRRAAASRIIASHPQMSDRAIARASGLGSKAVASIRRSSHSAGAQLNTRVGRDGRVRPLNSVEGRQRAAEVIAQNPGASLREVARLAGISPATASDVRKRLKSGEPPATTRSEVRPASERVAHEAPRTTTGPTPSSPPATGLDREARTLLASGKIPRQDRKDRPVTHLPGPVLDKLARDPSLRLKEEGRHLLRLLQQNAVAEWSGLTTVVPPHCGELIGSLARQYAANWLQLAEQLEKREQTFTAPGASSKAL